MCNLYSITTNQAAIIALFRVINHYVGNLPPMPGVFPDYPAPVVRGTDTGRELTMMRWGMPPPPRGANFPVTNIRNTSSPHWRAWLKAREPLPVGIVPAGPLLVLAMRGGGAPQRCGEIGLRSERRGVRAHASRES